MMEDVLQNKELAIRIALILIAAGVIISKLIDAAKGKYLLGRELVPEDTAGQWNQVLSFGIAALGFGLRYLGADAQIEPTMELATEAAAAILAAVAIMFSARLFRIGVKFIEGKLLPKAGAA